MGLSPIGITAEQFASLFPFHLIFDAELKLQQMGHVIARIYPDLQLGAILSDFFSLKKPKIAWDVAAIQEQPNAIFQLTASNAALELKGQMLWLDHANAMAFLGAPWVTDSAALSNLHLTLNDFAPHDPMVDFLFVVQAQKTSLEEVRKLSTSLTRQRAELRASEQKYRLLVENLHAVFFRADQDCSWTFLNRAWTTLTGLSVEQSLGTPISTYIHPTDRQALDQALARLIRHPDQALQTELRLITSDGATRWIEMSVYTSSEDQTVGLAGMLTDVTARHDEQIERTRLQEEIIRVQAVTLEELASPMIELGRGVLVLPLIGSVDSGRAQKITEALLQGVSEQRAHTVLVDITGVPVVDTHVANTLLRAAQAVKLLGAHIILTGIRPDVAQTLVGLGLKLDDLVTCSTLEQGLIFASRR